MPSPGGVVARASRRAMSRMRACYARAPLLAPAIRDAAVAGIHVMLPYCLLLSAIHATGRYVTKLNAASAVYATATNAFSRRDTPEAQCRSLCVVSSAKQKALAAMPCLRYAAARARRTHITLSARHALFNVMSSRAPPYGATRAAGTRLRELRYGRNARQMPYAVGPIPI